MVKHDILNPHAHFCVRDYGVDENVQHFFYCSFSGQAWNGILHWFGVFCAKYCVT